MDSEYQLIPNLPEGLTITPVVIPTNKPKKPKKRRGKLNSISPSKKRSINSKTKTHLESQAYFIEAGDDNNVSSSTNIDNGITTDDDELELGNIKSFISEVDIKPDPDDDEINLVESTESIIPISEPDEVKIKINLDEQSLEESDQHSDYEAGEIKPQLIQNDESLSISSKNSEDVEFSKCPHCDNLILNNFLIGHLKEHAVNNTLNYEKLKDLILSRKKIKKDSPTTPPPVEVQFSPLVKKSPLPQIVHSCNLCTFTCNRAVELRAHERTHEEEGYFRCKICLKSFKKASVLKIHERIHNGTAPHPCNLCNKTFNQRVHLRAHLRKHTGEKPFKCKHCTREYADNSSLIYHLRTHTGERPYQCHFCPKTHFAMHLREDSAVESSGNYLREEDEEGSSSSFKDPIFHLCRFCNKTFPTYAAVLSHETLHLGRKDHICQICATSFSQIKNLKAHMMSKHPQGSDIFGQSIEKKFICARCSERFSDIKSLNSHKTQMHPTA